MRTPVLQCLWGNSFPAYVLVPGDTLLFDFHAASVEEDEAKRWGFRASVIAHTLPLDAPEMLHMYRDVTAVCGMIAVQLMKGEELSHSFLDATLRSDIFSGGLEFRFLGSEEPTTKSILDFRSGERAFLHPPSLLPGAPSPSCFLFPHCFGVARSPRAGRSSRGSWFLAVL